MENKKIIIGSLMATGFFMSASPAEAQELDLSEPTTEITDENPIENKELIVSRESQTDTSITVAWTSIAKASSYSVYLDGTLYSENIVESKLEITGLSSANEYFITVKAYDTDNNIIGISNELCAYTNLTVSANMTLTEDLFVSNLFLNSGTLDLNGYNLYVNGNVWLTGGYLNINKGKLYINGDLNLSSADKRYGGGYLTMQNDEDYILVNGDMLVYSYYNYSKLTAGTIELKGDFAQKVYSHSNNFCPSGTHKMLLSGDTLQTISFASTSSGFNVVEITKPLETGYVFSNVTYNKITENYGVSTPPSAPWGLSFVRSTSTSILMTWNASVGEKDIFCYEVYRDGNLVGTTTNTEYIDNGLKSHSKYEYYIIAKDVANYSSAKSEVISAYTNVDAYAPTTPAGLTATIREDGSVYLSWISSSDNVSVDGYNIYRSGEHIGTSVGNTYSDISVEPGYHEYYVEAFDNEGNNSLYSSCVYADNMPPKKPVLHISEITPMHISFKWNSEDNVEIDHFEVYKDDEFLKTTNFNEYTDTAVTAGSEHLYYVIAIDTSGNKSETSDRKKIVAKNDEKKPEAIIYSQTLTEGNKSLKITCIDDVMLSSLTAEIKSPSSEEWFSLATKSLSQKSQIVKLELNDYLTIAGDYQVRVYLTDTAGNTNSVESEFKYVKNELADITVSANSNGCSTDLSWASVSDNPKVYYEIRRVDPDGTERHIATTKYNELSYTDVGLYPFSEYSYFVIARDENLYSTESNKITITSGKDTIAPTSVIDGFSKTIVGYVASFDGSGSTDIHSIEKYEWDFGDGQTAEGEKVNHKFSKSGDYTVILTVTDESGNSSSSEFDVTVYDEDYSISEIQVTDENGKSIPYPNIFFETEDSTNNVFKGNKDGIALIVAKSGTYDFCFYAYNYLPSKQNFTIEGIKIGEMCEKISLVKSELITAKFEIEELDIEEIENRGIDITAPENQHVSKVQMTIKNNETGSGSNEDLSKFNIYVNQEGEIISVEHNDSFTAPVYGVIHTSHTSEVKDKGTVKTTTTISTLGSAINKAEDSKYIPRDESVLQFIKGTVISLSVTEYSWLKDFYDVSITLTNNAPEGFDIINPKAKISLPNGLSFANEINSEECIINTIKGGTSETISWTIKGDSSGEYTVEVHVDGTLTPFGIPVEADFSNYDKPIIVEGGKALHLKLNASGSKADFTLTNVSEKPVYNVQVNMDSYAEFNDAYMILSKYPTGMIEKITWNTDKSNTIHTTYLPVEIPQDYDLFDLRTLGTQDSNNKIIGIIYYKFNDVE